jgi:hypothetical protein
LSFLSTLRDRAKTSNLNAPGLDRRGGVNVARKVRNATVVAALAR